MVAPLAVLALWWDHRDWGSANWLSGRKIRLGRRPVPLWSFLSGGLLVAMGALTIVLAFTNAGMSTDGWAARTAAGLRHWTALILDGAATVPGLITSLAVLGALAWLIVRAVRGPRTGTEVAPAEITPAETSPAETHPADACCATEPDPEHPTKENA